MKRLGLAGAVSLLLATAAAADDARPKGLLPEKEGLVVAGRVVGEGTEPIHLQLGRDVAAEVILHGRDWSFRTADVRPGSEFRFTGLPPGHYCVWTQGRRVQEIDVFSDVTGVEFRALEKRLKGIVRPGFETKSRRMIIEFTAADGTGETRFEVTPGVEFTTPPLSLGRHAVEMWWIQEDRSWWDDPHRWTWVDITADTERFDFDFVPAADVALSVKSAGTSDEFKGRVFDADLPDGAGFPFQASPQGTSTWTRGPFGAWFGGPRPSVPLLNTTRGRHRLRLDAPGFETLERPVIVGEGTTAVDVEMKPVPGTFVFAEGWGKIFEVFVRPAGTGGPWKSLLFGDNRNPPTDTEPNRPRELLAPGKWEIFATSGDMAPSRPQTFELGADHAEVKIDLPGVPGATLTATLKAPSGAPLTSTETYLLFQSTDGWRLLRAKAPIIDERGAFEIKGLAPGAYRLAFDAGGRHVAGEFEVEGKDVRKDFVFDRRR